MTENSFCPLPYRFMTFQLKAKSSFRSNVILVQKRRNDRQSIKKGHTTTDTGSRSILPIRSHPSKTDVRLLLAGRKDWSIMMRNLLVQ